MEQALPNSSRAAEAQNAGHPACSELVLDRLSGFLMLFPTPLLPVGFPPALPWCANTQLGCVVWPAVPLRNHVWLRGEQPGGTGAQQDGGVRVFIA